VRADGSACDTEVTAVANVLPGRHLLVLHDITERNRFQSERELFLAELEAIVNATTDGVILYGPEGEILRMNPAAEAIFPYSAEERRRPLKERWAFGEKVEPDGNPFPLEKLPASRVLAGEGAQAEMISFRRPDGRTLWLMAGAAPVRSPDGRIWGAVGTYTDVSRVHQLAEENETYVHMIAHDLRNPLTVILGHAEMLRPVVEGAGLGDVPALNVDSIGNAATQMARMMEDLVDLARLQGGQMKLEREAVDLRTFLRDLLERSGVAMDVARVSMEVTAELPPAWADPHALERVFVNLVSNALKYSTPEQPVKVRACRENDHLLCSVADHGPGIDPHELPHIFDRFYRARLAGRHPGGLGLGLSITKLIVEAHGGAIRVESAVGEGSTFFFTLPVA
jgi:PAS domain S-box-containing protein